jgi:hypothetical protein
MTMVEFRRRMSMAEVQNWMGFYRWEREVQDRADRGAR